MVLLGLLPVLSDTASLFWLEKFTATRIDKDCTTRESLIKSWSYGIATINGIERFLKFSYSNRMRYKRIVTKISAISYLEEMAEKVK